MSNFVEAPEQIFFDALKEHRGAYFVEYRPPAKFRNFATLFLVFTEVAETQQVSDLMRSELQIWLRRYPVPLMVSAFDAAENLIRANDGRNIHLVGWLPPSGEISASWKLDDLSAFVKSAPPSDWRPIYTDIGYTTEGQVKANADKYVQERRQQIRVLKIILGLWFCVVPATWAIVQYVGSEWLARGVVIYALWQAWRTWLKVSGGSRPSPQELAKAAKTRKMEHFYYHCERNPIGFARLKAENLDKEISANARKEAAALLAGAENRKAASNVTSERP